MPSVARFELSACSAFVTALGFVMFSVAKPAVRQAELFVPVSRPYVLAPPT
jgi:hypothetical protein